MFAYDVQTTQTTIRAYVYNNNGGAKNFYISELKEGSLTEEVEANRKTELASKESKMIERTITNTTNSTVFFYASTTDVWIYQIEIVESGDPLLKGGEPGYVLNCNKGRASFSNSVVEIIDSIEAILKDNARPYNETKIIIKTTGTHYVGFNVVVPCTLRITTSNSDINRKYNVSQTKFDTDNSQGYHANSGTQDVPLTNRGKWYINASGNMDVQISRLEFLPINYDITFNNNGKGTAPDALNAARAILRPITDGGAIQTGWTANEDVVVDNVVVAAGETIDCGKAAFVTKATQFTAVWGSSAYTVKFMDGTTELSSQSVEQDGYATAPADPEVYAKQFLGWTIDGTNTVDVAATPINAATTFYALWQDLETWPVSFNSKGGSDVAGINIVKSQTIPTGMIPADPTRAGYDFGGWSRGRMAVLWWILLRLLLQRLRRTMLYGRMMSSH